LDFSLELEQEDTDSINNLLYMLNVSTSINYKICFTIPS